MKKVKARVLGRPRELPVVLAVPMALLILSFLPVIGLLFGAVMLSGKNGPRLPNRMADAGIGLWCTFASLALGTGTWYLVWALGVPPSGPPGHWVALLLAYLAAFAAGLASLITCLAGGLDGVRRSQRRMFVSGCAGASMMMALFNVPLALYIAIIAINRAPF